MWAFHDLSDTRGPFKQAVDPTTAERLGAARLLKSEDKNIYVWLLNGALRQALLRRGVRLDPAHNRYYFLPDHETITKAERQIRPLLDQRRHVIQPAGTHVQTLAGLTAFAAAHGVTLIPGTKAAR